MLTVSPITQNHGQNRVQKKNVSFGSEFIPTDYLKRGFNNALTNLKDHRAENEAKERAIKFLDAIIGFLGDGKNNKIKIDSIPGTEAIGLARNYDIYVNDVKTVSNGYHPGSYTEETHCQQAIINFAEKEGVGKPATSEATKQWGALTQDLKTKLANTQEQYATAAEKELGQHGRNMFGRSWQFELT